MGNIFSDTTAPYVLVAAIGAAGWLVNNSIEELKNSRIVEYYVQDESRGGQHHKKIEIRNISMAFDLNEGKFTINCRGNGHMNCFGQRNGGNPVTVISNMGSIDTNIQPYLSNSNWSVPAIVARKTSITLDVMMASAESDIFILHEHGDSSGSGNQPTVAFQPIAFQPGPSLEGWLVENYLKILLGILFSLIIALGLWLAAAFAAFAKDRLVKSEPQKEAVQTLRIILERGSRSHE